MAIVEKYRVRRPLTFNGRKFDRGDAIARSYICEVDPSKEGSLLRTGFLEPDHVRTGDPDALDTLTKVELVDYARTVGIEGPIGSWRKADLVDAIKEATHHGS